MAIVRNMCLVFLATSALIVLASGADFYSDALLSFKSEIIDEYNSLDDWKVASEDNFPGKVKACSWSGVKCDKNSTVITGLDLSKKNLAGKLSGEQFSVFTELNELNLSQNSFSGQLPVHIYNLTSLETLDISRNNFFGLFPGGISALRNLVVLNAFSNSFSGPLPADVSNLEHLKVLNFAGSYFRGPIPSEYGNFKNLELIHLAGNFLEGSLPPELGKLKTVTHMEIGYNTYEGSIPWQMGNMSELRYLDIAGANLSGLIPRDFGNLSKLRSLFLFRNQLTGKIPWELGKIVPLTNLDLSDNKLSGPIPESFAGLKNLKLLSLFYNEMNGRIPEGVARLPSLETLLIWNNYFSGSLPDTLGGNSDLKLIDVSANSFDGGIPRSICSKGVLVKLMLFSNKFSGDLSSISNCSSLVRLRLEDNSFSGQIPLIFDHLPDIAYIDLSRNNFTGGIPRDIHRASKLEYFNVSGNLHLGGTIPIELWSLSLLQNFSASSCNISGKLPHFESCESISFVELRKNHLSGILPESMSKCQALEKVDLANNRFTGEIPKELASLPLLSVLDLSRNNLNGSIPAKLGKSSSLLLLNVSFNDISGSIPSGKTLRAMGSSAFFGNTKLCGAPLQPCPNSILGGKGKIVWVLLLCTCSIILLSLTIMGIIYYLSRGQWKMVSFSGLPQFTAKDVLRSFSSTESTDSLLPLSAPVSKAVLPTGIVVSVKMIQWEAKRTKVMSEFIAKIGNARHKNLVRLLGYCYNNDIAYLLYDYLPNGNLAEKIDTKRDWAAKYRLVTCIAKGLCFLHHDCYPAIPHGDLKSANVMFDENMEPQITNVGYKYLAQLTKDSYCTILRRSQIGELDTHIDEYDNCIKEELNTDIYNFGEITLEILTNGRLTNARGSLHNKPVNSLLEEVYRINEVPSIATQKEEMKLVLEVALLCTRNRPSDRPSMDDILKLLSVSNTPRKRSS